MLSRQAFRSLRHRNFRIYYLGQLISLNGTWMQSVAQSWLIYRLTDSGFMLGLAGTLLLLPNLVLGLFGGMVADRFPRRQVLVLVQSLALLQALTLGILTVAGWVQPWHILVLALMLGIVQALETPVRQSFISELVPRNDLTNAIALNSSMFHLARFFGPAIAGVLVAIMGEGPVFLINSVSFVAVLISLCMVRVPPLPLVPENKRGWRRVLSGFEYAWQHGLIRSLLFMVATVSLLGGATVVLLPLFVDRVFEHGPESLGVFMGVLGAGSLLAALRLANQVEYRWLERRVALAGIAVGSALLVFAFNDIYVLAFPLLLVIGFSSTTVFASSNALIQLSVPEHLRGRVMALYTICLHGMVSLGQLMLGSVADFIGAPFTVAISGAILMGVAIGLAVVLYRLVMPEREVETDP